VERRTKFLKEELPKSLATLEELLRDNEGGDGFFVGDAVYDLILEILQKVVL